MKGRWLDVNADGGAPCVDQRTHERLAQVSRTSRHENRHCVVIFSSERQLDRQLHLPRVADAGPEESVEIEKRRRRERVDVVGVVERVEHLRRRNHLNAAAEAEGPGQPPIETEVRIVFPQGVASEIDAVHDAWRRRNRLRAARLRARVELDASRDLEVAVQVELVSDVAIRQRVIERQVVEIERPIAERVALVLIVVLVLREHVVGF